MYIKAKLQQTQEILKCHQEETRNYLKQETRLNIILVLKIDVGRQSSKYWEKSLQNFLEKLLLVYKSMPS